MKDIAKRLIDVEEYYKMAEAGILKPTDRVELIHGEIIKMSPVSSKHAGLVKKLNKILNKALGDDFIIGVQDPVKIDNENEPEPDLSILKFRQDSYTGEHPKAEEVLCIIEVSGSSYDYDTNIKSLLYASAKIETYWVIDIDNKRVEVFSNPKDGRYRKKEEYERGDQIELLGLALTSENFLP